MGNGTQQEEPTNNGTTENIRVAGPSLFAKGEWSSSMESELRWMWELHVYGAASLFSMLAVLCLFTVLRLRAQLSQSRNLSSLNVFLGILASVRLLVLYVDPYGSKMVLPAVMLRVLWDLGYPCLVSSFSLSAVREGGEVKKTARLNESTASIAITLHFSFVITAGVLGTVHNWLRVVWAVTQVVFIVWGCFLFLSTLLACLQVLRSMMKVPLRFLTQVDPGCEVNNIVPQGMFTEKSQENRQSNHHPRIHITDVDEQTYSYASEGSLALRADMQRSESLPMRCLVSSSPSRTNPPDMIAKNEDPAVVKPLIDKNRRHTITDKVSHQVNGPETIFTFQPPSPRRPHSLLIPSILAEDIKRETRRLKNPNRSRLEKNLRQLIFTSSLGLALCLLRTYEMLGLKGRLSPCGSSLAWFLYQTASRFVELVMAFTMVCGCQQSLNNRYYYYRN